MSEDDAFAWCGREIHVVDREALRREHAADHRGHFTQRERKDFGAVCTLLAVRSFPLSSICTGAFGSIRLSHAACGNNEVRGAAPSVPYTNGPASRPPAADASLVSSVAAAPSASTLRTLLSRGLSNLLYVSAVKKQHAVRLLGFDQALSQPEAVT